MIGEQINQLIEEITQNNSSEEIFQAKKEFNAISGEIFEDDKSYESRMGMFLEWYAFDRVRPETGMTPLESYLHHSDPASHSEKWELAESVSKCTHSLFTTKKIKADSIVAADLLDGGKFEVEEKQASMLFNLDDYFEARIIPYQGKNYFTENFCYHLKPARSYIKTKIKQLLSREQDNLAKKSRLEKELAGPKKARTKILTRLEKLEAKLQKATKEKKIQSITGDISALQEQARQLESGISELENQLQDLTENTILKGHQEQRFLFIRKLSYMSLKWERSRQIDVRDIYQD
ncbi:MAG: hypothetical protein GWM98_29515 [Nitrospinaceae bacterium]|nr:hypothetical protein [Nitrospinaceae bacterium]NIR57839.1 hypothetical protein [Nitrospinaceae bacterium]NIS88302.1 hypothetical protein [Nitrospinaceae bacterium]NIT85180.1 hypothetical protein [Nitrospinaceae bacterium]NIU44267.1 hypothetical protein [Nitrospinaceae bacterium]